MDQGAAQKKVAICFWTDANYTEVERLAKAGCPGLDWHMTQDHPGGGVILAMGADRHKLLQAQGVCHKGRTIESMRGTVIKHSAGQILLTYAPGIRHSVADAMSQITWDVRLAARLAKNGHIRPIVGQYTWVDDLAEFIEHIEVQYALSNCWAAIAERPDVYHSEAASDESLFG